MVSQPGLVPDEYVYTHGRAVPPGKGACSLAKFTDIWQEGRFRTLHHRDRCWKQLRTWSGASPTARYSGTYRHCSRGIRDCEAQRTS